MGPFGVRGSVSVEKQQVTQVSVKATEAEVNYVDLGAQKQHQIYPFILSKGRRWGHSLHLPVLA